MATTVTVKGQVTIPKAVRDAAGIRPGDRVDVTAKGGVVMVTRAPEPDVAAAADRIARAVAELRARGIRLRRTADSIMRLTRDDP